MLVEAGSRFSADRRSVVKSAHLAHSQRIVTRSSRLDRQIYLVHGEITSVVFSNIGSNDTEADLPV
jgi:hypothetical protein